MSTSFLIALAASTGILGSILKLRARAQSTQLLAAVAISMAAVAAYELFWLWMLAPVFGNPAAGAQFAGNHPLGMLILDLLPPAVVAAIVWCWSFGRWHSVQAFCSLTIVGIFLAAGAAAIVRPMYLRGVAEAIGMLKPLSAYHLSGVYDPTIRRYVAYVVVVPWGGFLLGLWRFEGKPAS